MQPLSSVRIRGLAKLKANNDNRGRQIYYTMNHLSVVTLTLLCGISGALAARRYIAIPVDGFDVIEFNPVGAASQSLSRIGRRTETHRDVPPPPPAAVASTTTTDHREDFERSERSFGEKPGRILDYVDFGSQTGSNGAFGWYADYPVQRS